MPKTSDYCTCRFKNCLHGDDKQLLKSEAVKVGSQYYHPDCYETNKNINKLIDYFIKEINPDVVYPVLVRTIYTILFPKNKERVSAERLFFQVKYFNEHGGKLRYPGGMYYALQNRDAYDAYQKYLEIKAKQEISKYDFSVDEKEDLTDQPKVRIQKQKGFEDILGG